MNTDDQELGGHDDDRDHDPDAHPVTINIDNEDFRIPDRLTTPRALLALVGKTPGNAYLVGVDGRNQTSYKGRPDEQIRVHEHQRFITVADGPTPVS